MENSIHLWLLLWYILILKLHSIVILARNVYIGHTVIKQKTKILQQTTRMEQKSNGHQHHCERLNQNRKPLRATNENNI
jgi:hypothetical protein